jgi:hypothetical protein
VIAESDKKHDRFDAERLAQEIRAMDREVERLCRDRYRKIAPLRQVSGVGPLTALSSVPETIQERLTHRASGTRREDRPKEKLRGGRVSFHAGGRQ